MDEKLVEKVARAISPEAFNDDRFADPGGRGQQWAIDDARRRARAALSATPLDAMHWFGTQRRLTLDFHAAVYCDDDDQSEEWRVHQVNGSINDREWEVVGRGETPLAAIIAARAALAQVKP